MVVSCFNEKCSKTLFFVGVFQLLLAYILVGWVLSVYWGYLIARKAFFEDQNEVENFLKGVNARSDQPPSNIGGGIGGQTSFSGFPAQGSNLRR